MAMANRFKFKSRGHLTGFKTDTLHGTATNTLKSFPIVHVSLFIVKSAVHF